MVDWKITVASRPAIDIVMATYNGGRFLAEQLDSLLAQDWENIRVLVSDDGSTDSTLEILRQYADRHPAQFFVGQNQIRQGATGNFAGLMRRSTADYVAFCDQDDIWKPNKLTRCMVAMSNIEAEGGASVPVLIYTDMKLVSSTGVIRAESHWENAGVRPYGASFRNLLAQNLVTGCTMIANRALINVAIPMPIERVMMHDYWMALIASAFGALHPLMEQTVLYRQHDKNAVGAGGTLTVMQRLDRFRSDPNLENWLRSAGIQAEAFLEMFGSRLTGKDQLALTSVAGLSDGSWAKRNIELLNHGVRRTGLLNQLQFMMRL